jgi:serine/threonine protein kinase
MYDFRAAVAGIYDIEAPLGRGGMALVYLARERRLDRRVALKVLDLSSPPMKCTAAGFSARRAWWRD